MEAEEIARQETQAELAVATEWSGLITDFVIENDEQQEEVASVLRDVKARYRALEEKRKEITVPLNRALKAVNDLFRPPKAKFEALEHLLKSKIAGYLDAKEQVNRDAVENASVAESAKDALDSLAQVSEVAPPQGVSIRKVWKFEVTDADAVPREYCSPDLKKIGAADPTTAIPGVRFFQDSVVTARR